MNARQEDRRLFVPLAKEPFRWFQSGAKLWEVRRSRGAYSANNVRVGRRVELRRGYRASSPSLWATVTEVEVAPTLRIMMRRIPFNEAIPEALNCSTAVEEAASILRVSPDEEVGIIAFRVRLDTPEVRVAEIALNRKYRESVINGSKITTVRRYSGQFAPGPAILRFGPGDQLPAVVTAVTHTTATRLNDGDARRDGFGSREELFDALRQHYPDLRDCDLITIVEFKCPT